MREETGYEVEEIIHLGSVAPNPAFLNNQCHSYLALGVRPVHAVALDGAEDIAFEEIPLAAIPDLIRAGAITHSLTITAFHYLGLYEEQKNLTQRTPREQRAQKGFKKSAIDMTSVPENDIAKHIVDAAYHIHKQLGPGLLESAYEAILAHELESRGLRVQRQLIVPVTYDSLHVGAAYRLDLLVEDLVIIELKSTEVMHSVFPKQLLTYLKLADKRLGLILNFGMETMKEGIKRVVSGLPT